MLIAGAALAQSIRVGGGSGGSSTDPNAVHRTGTESADGDKTWTGDAGFAANTNVPNLEAYFVTCKVDATNPYGICYFQGNRAHPIGGGNGVFEFNAAGASLDGTDDVLVIKNNGVYKAAITANGQFKATDNNNEPAFLDNSSGSGHVALGSAYPLYVTIAGNISACADFTNNQATCSYGSPYGGIHGAITIINSNPQDAGFIFQAIQQSGVLAPSEWLIDFKGASVQLNPQTLANFDGCPQALMPFDGGNPYGQQFAGEFETAQRYAADKHGYYVCDGTGWASILQSVPGTAGTRGTATLSSGTKTVTVNSGCTCVATDTTAVNNVKCSVSGTTMTLTGTGSDVLNWICY